MALSKEFGDAGPRNNDNSSICGNDGLINLEVPMPSGKLSRNIFFYTGKRGRSTNDQIGTESTLERNMSVSGGAITNGNDYLSPIKQIVPQNSCFRDGDRGGNDEDRGTSEDQYHNMRMSPRELEELRKEQAERRLRERLKGKRIRSPNELGIKHWKSYLRTKKLFIDDD